MGGEREAVLAMSSSRGLVVLVLIALLVGSSGSTAIAADAQMERFVFVHQPRAHAPAEILDAVQPASIGRGLGLTCPDPATCIDSKWTRYRWTGQVVYELDAVGSGLGQAVAMSAMSASFAAWVSPTAGGLSVSGGLGSTACSAAGAVRNEVNQVCWRDLTDHFPNAIAVTFVWATRGTKQIAEADTVFNSASGFSWSYTDPGTCETYGSCNAPSGLTSYDVRDIGTHEFGHFLALLGDLYKRLDTELTMYGYGVVGELRKDSLGKGDCLGITAAYGGSCP